MRSKTELFEQVRERLSHRLIIVNYGYKGTFPHALSPMGLHKGTMRQSTKVVHCTLVLASAHDAAASDKVIRGSAAAWCRREGHLAPWNPASVDAGVVTLCCCWVVPNVGRQLILERRIHRVAK